MIKELKKISDSKIILGGKGVFTHDERKYFRGLADYFVIGEGEEPIYELIDGLKKGLSEEELSKIKGVISDKFPKNYRPRPAMDLKTKGFPDYKEFNFSRYAERSLGIILSQGCIGSCYFCEDKGFQGHYTTRDPDIVAKEMIYHYKKNRIRKFWFNDLAINGDYKALEKLCDNIIKRRIKIRWIALAIPRSDVPTELIYKMKKSG